MKQIRAYIQPFMLSKVTLALQKIPEFPGMSVSGCKGFGRGKADKEKHRIIEDLVEYVPKVRIEIVVKDEIVDEVVQTIEQAAHTGNRGDGKIFVMNVEQAVRIRTGERGDDAIWSKIKDD